jgi:hypothetical protein
MGYAIGVCLGRGPGEQPKIPGWTVLLLARAPLPTIDEAFPPARRERGGELWMMRLM